MTDESLFAAALAIASPAERAAFLDRACAGNPILRREVEELLAAHAADNPLDRPPADLARTGAYDPADDEPPPAAVGDRIGPYRLMEQIGEGGFGLVFVAEQTEPVRRKVALKVLKPGMDTRDVVARFEAERQALALMDHPNIARVLDAGSTPAGRPYFVMELVRGVPITDYCDQQRLPPRDRLALFVQVCHAVQHAHQKGVIHRDLKPSNVLVTSHDGVAVPKVIDFGVAKAVGQSLTEKTIYTRFAQMIGTPLYMSPEQAEMSGLDVDTRSDVYALGVLLYELLTGTTPFDKDRFRKAAFDEIRRIIREEEPPRPSTRLTSLGATLTAVSANRATDAARLAGLVRGELDWIVMRCLEKDRNRRYESASGLAKDVQRYLAGDAVEACPPTLGYRLRKFVRRNRPQVVAAGLVLLALLAGVIGTTFGLLRAEQRRRDAEQARADEAAQRGIAEAKTVEAQQREAEANQARWETLEEKFKSDIKAIGLQVDLDLIEYQTDPKVGLLRLAKPRRDTSFAFKTRNIPIDYDGEEFVATTVVHYKDRADYRPLREFVTAAVLAAGQDYAPLLPPITHDGQPVVFTALSPDNRTLLTLGKDSTARLWDARSARQLAVLRKGDERVVNCGFSPDGRTVFTDDLSSVARFWDVPSGRFRAATPARPNRYSLIPDDFNLGMSARTAARLGDGRLLTYRPEVTRVWQGPVELWDTVTGRLVARLDAPGRSVEHFQFLNNGRWVTTLEGRSTRLVFSAEDGRLLARLKTPDGEEFSPDRIDASPTGRRIATVTEKLEKGGVTGRAIRVWDVETGQAQSLTTIPLYGLGGEDAIRYWMDDPAGAGSVVAVGWEGGWIAFRVGQNEPIAEFRGLGVWSPDLLALQARAGDLVHGGNGWVWDTRTWQRLLPPPGRKFHPELDRFAPDGRFVSTVMSEGGVLIDTRTDKVLPTPYHPWRVLPAEGMIAGGDAIRLIPPASKLDLPPDLLELWAQVAARGELDAEGRFHKWDEQTWERKRQALAARKPPHPDFPFPGHVAADRLHWLRAEFAEAKTDADRLRLATDLLRRAEAAGDRAEAVRWRAEVESRAREAIPPPREGKG